MEDIPNNEKEPTSSDMIEMFNLARERTRIEGEAAIDFLVDEFKAGKIDLKYLMSEAERTGHHSVHRTLVEIYKERGFSTKNIPE